MTDSFPRGFYGVALFDAYLMVDWSAASVPVRAENSIWLGLHRPGKRDRLENPTTRHAAQTRILELLRGEVEAGRRVLCGFDFAFAYPGDFMERLPADGNKRPWERAWRLIAELVQDDARNRNNRFEAASELNRRVGKGAGPFWGCPASRENRLLSMRKAKANKSGFREYRLTDRADTGAGKPQSAFKLAGAGSVGGQTLTGIPRVRAIRSARGLAGKTRVWPFETGLVAPRAPVVLAEVYPSMITVRPKNEVKDKAQVRDLARRFASLDEKDELAECFRGPRNATRREKETIRSREGWILGVR